MIKKCSHCKSVLDESAFNWKVTDVQRASNCKECSRKYIRSHYSKNKTYYIRKAKIKNLELRQESIEYIGNYLRTHKCVDCGESNILVLEFDHKVRTTKVKEVSLLIKQRISLKRVIEEIEKCEVRCANCHRKKTAIENNSWKLKFAPVA